MSFTLTIDGLWAVIAIALLVVVPAIVQLWKR